MAVCGSLSQRLSNAVISNAHTPLITQPGSRVGWHSGSMCVCVSACVCATPCSRGGSVYPEHKQRLAAGLVRLAMIGHCEMWLTEAACCPLHCNFVCLYVCVHALLCLRTLVCVWIICRFH